MHFIKSVSWIMHVGGESRESGEVERDTTGGWPGLSNESRKDKTKQKEKDKRHEMWKRRHGSVKRESYSARTTQSVSYYITFDREGKEWRVQSSEKKQSTGQSAEYLAEKHNRQKLAKENKGLVRAHNNFQAMYRAAGRHVRTTR